MTPPIQIKTDKRGFRTKITPITNAGMQVYAKSVERHFNNQRNGLAPFRRILQVAPSILTISGGSITTTLNQHIVAAQTGTADDLDTITAANNKLVFLRADTGDTITLRHGVGNIVVPGGNNNVLSGYRGVLLICDAGYWAAICTTGAKSNFSATVDPGSGDDIGDGYSVG